jgi:hypothetical protein
VTQSATVFFYSAPAIPASRFQLNQLDTYGGLQKVPVNIHSIAQYTLAQVRKFKLNLIYL